MNQKTFPKLTKHTFLKGCKGNFLIADFLNDLLYPISEAQAKLLKSCNGTKSLFALSKEFKVTPSALRQFFGKFTLKNLMILQEKPDLNDKKFFSLNVRAPWLEEVQIDLSYRCNLKCKHCFQSEFNKENTLDSLQELSQKTVCSILEQAAKMNVLRINLSGGEPLIYKNIHNVLKLIKGYNLLLSVIFTNGTILSDWFLKFLKATRHPTMLQISLDGANAKSHNYLRGNGSFEKVVNTLRKLRDLKNEGACFEYGVNSTIHRKNQGEVMQMYRLIQELQVPVWRVSVARQQGSYMKNQKKLQSNLDLVLSQYRELIQRYIYEYQTARQRQIVKHLTVEGFFKTTYLSRGVWNTATKESATCEYKKRMLCFKPNGDAVSCTAFEGYVIGNIYEESLKQIWYSDRARFIKDLPVKYVEECQKCDVLNICGTGCRAIALKRSGRLKAKHLLACRLMHFAKEEILPLLKDAGVKLRPI